MATAWIDVRAAKGSVDIDAVRSSLLAAGVEILPERDDRCQAGLVVFDRCDDALFEVVRERSNDGLFRLVALATDARALSSVAAWSLRHAGASDVFSWDHSSSPAQEIKARLARWEEVDGIVRSQLVRNHLVGQSRAWIMALRQIVEVAAFSDGTVLLLGESGTGKELVARLIHTLDRRPGKRDLVVLDGTTVIPELAGSEFFGHEKGAFTGAVGARDGAFALAEGGTLFLDEVGELPLPLQAQLLRVVQERTYKRVGGNQWLRAEFRLVAATNRELDEGVAAGSFRRDFFHRIASRVCRIPPLRERDDDVLVLAAHFFRELRPESPAAPLDPAVREYFLTRDYPGNIRDLRQLVGRVTDRYVGTGPVTVGCLPVGELPGRGTTVGWRDDAFERTIRRALELGAGLQAIKEAVSNRAFAMALEMEGGNSGRAAKRLEVTERAVQMHRAEKRGFGRSSEPASA